jgi:hypothetical protein
MGKLALALGIIITLSGAVSGIYYAGMLHERSETKAEKYDHLAKATQGIVDEFTKLSAQTAELNAIKDDSRSGPALTAAADVVWDPKSGRTNPSPAAP